MSFTIPTRWAVLLLALPVTLAVVRGVRDLGDYSTAARELDEATAANAECDLESGSLNVSIEAKLAVAAEYEAGRITLRAAARRFLQLTSNEKAVTNLRRLWPTADDDEERCAASVVRYLYQSGDEVRPTTAAYQRAVADFAREYGTSVDLHAAP